MFHYILNKYITRVHKHASWWIHSQIHKNTMFAVSDEIKFCFAYFKLGSELIVTHTYLSRNNCANLKVFGYLFSSSKKKHVSIAIFVGWIDSWCVLWQFAFELVRNFVKKIMCFSNLRSRFSIILFDLFVFSNEDNIDEWTSYSRRINRFVLSIVCMYPPVWSKMYKTAKPHACCFHLVSIVRFSRLCLYKITLALDFSSSSTFTSN